MSQDATAQPLTRVTHLSDAEIAQLLSRALETSRGPVSVVFRDEAVAELWRSERVTAVAWGGALARRLIERVPPSPPDRVAPPPVIVGDGPLAGTLLEELVAGWSEPGQPLTVHCLGWDDRWAQEGAAWAGSAAEVSWVRVPLRASSMVTSIRRLVSRWEPPPSEHGTPAGPTVYVACADDAVSAVIADAVSMRVTDARVARVGDTSWPLGSVVSVTPSQVVEQVLDGTITVTGTLARCIFAEVAWLSAPDAAATQPAESLWGPISFEHGVASWEVQPEHVRRRFLAVAEDIHGLLAFARVHVSRHGREPNVVVLTPGELAAVASELLTLLGVSRTPGTWQTVVELAARLPVLAARAGYTVRRAERYQPLLSVELIELLAPQVHMAYQRVSCETGNASGSPLAAALWNGLSPFQRASNRLVIAGSAIACAVMGLDWCSTSDGMPGAVLSEEQLERLGELEHRRWAITARRNGRRDHRWAVPWNELPEGTQRYDIEIMRAMPHILGDANVQLVWAQPSPSGT